MLQENFAKIQAFISAAEKSTTCELVFKNPINMHIHIWPSMCILYQPIIRTTLRTTSRLYEMVSISYGTQCHVHDDRQIRTPYHYRTIDAGCKLAYFGQNINYPMFDIFQHPAWPGDVGMGGMSVTWWK